MEETPAHLTAKPSWLLTQVAVHAHRLASEGFGEVGARGYHYRILAALDEFGVASQAELGRRCNMDRSDVVAAINELAGRDHVERTPDPDDRRRNRVTLTRRAVGSCDAWTERLTGCRTTCWNRCRPRTGRP